MLGELDAAASNVREMLREPVDPETAAGSAYLLGRAAIVEGHTSRALGAARVILAGAKAAHAAVNPDFTPSPDPSGSGRGDAGDNAGGAGAGGRWPDVTPAPGVEYSEVEGRIRSAAWLAGESHRRKRLETARLFGDPIALSEGPGSAYRWDSSDWDAATVEYYRLQGHPFVGIGGECPVCGHIGESCDGVRTQRLYGPAGPSGPELVRGAGPGVVAVLTWRYAYTGRHLARGRAERRPMGIRLTLTGPMRSADRGTVRTFPRGRVNLTRAMATAEIATGGVRWEGDSW